MKCSPLIFPVLLGAGVLGGASALLAIHPKNAGPESVELKFKLPAPKPLSPEEELATFKVAPGFRVELVAAEPLVESPVAMAWDEKGRLYVCEMRGYMHTLEGEGEDEPSGRIVCLEDTDGDGKMDRRTVFAEGLVMPRSVACVNGGLLVGEPPRLWWMRDADGDGAAEHWEEVDSAYGMAGGQPEHMANSTTWMLDNWIYSASHAKRFRLKGGKFVEEVAGLRGQWGLTQDDWGRMYFNTNSNFLVANLVPESLAKRNPNYPNPFGVGVQVLKDQVTWPSHPTPGVNRGYDEKTLRPDGSLTASTATCGPGIYRGHLFPKEYRGNAFIPEPAGNLVKRVVLSEKGGAVEGSNPTVGVEFWTSTDERFRPVNAYTGPDGALYVVDLYRGIIQHKSFLTHYLVANIKDRQLENPFNQGRIWRVVPAKGKVEPMQMPTDAALLVKQLEHPNGWVRDTAQRVLVERREMSVTGALEAVVRGSKSALARVHALWVLEGLGALTPELISQALKDTEGRVRATAVRLSGRVQAAELAAMVGDSSLEVQVALGFQLSSYPETQTALVELAAKRGSQEMVRDAILSGLRGRELDALRGLTEIKGPLPSSMLGALSQAVMAERRKERVESLLQLIAAQPANAATQVAILAGAAGKPASAKVPVKLLYLDGEPAVLAELSQKAHGSSKELLKTLGARLAWPGKPGVPPPPVVKPLSDSELALFEKGKATYSGLCAGCHQPSGLGMHGLAPALVDSEWVLSVPEIAARIILHGLAGPIKVGPVSWNLEMPPLGAALSDDQIASVLTYIRREWEHTASPVSPATVAKVRKDFASRTKSWSESELRAAMNPKAPKKEKEAPEGVKSKGAPISSN
jgi:glucose/arabinose dehydrogenase/mono/diheme cytochrome c family protein